MKSKGQSLIEILIAIAVTAVIVVGVANLVSVSLRASKASRQTAYAQTLLQDMIAAVRSVSSQDWHSLWSSTKGVLYLAMDEGAGAASDNSKVIDPISGNNGTIVIGPAGNSSLASAWQASSNCKAGQCLDFDGADDIVQLDGQPAISSAFSITAWAKSDNLTGHQNIFNNNQFFIRKDSPGEGNKFSVFVKLTDGTVEPRAQSTTVAATSTWYFVAGTWDGSTLSMYVNGVPEGTSARSGTATSTTITAQIGGGEQTNPAGNYWNGIIDEVRVYSRALSQSEIEALYNGINKLTPVNVGGFWQIQEGTSTVSNLGVTYTRYFTISAAQRATTTDDIVSSGGNDDPATKKFTYVVSWPAKTVTNEEYVTRFQTSIFRQTDWSGGATTTLPFILPGNVYETATSVDVTSTPGVIKLGPQ